ncbi:hypothetical protein [Algoriphagus antarcticus]|uniref:Uncharacterized protein n=1 Tax=Algoriphagus antarcticus TaxID=238540 RepID=A0A3E0DID2_9BACT|nr:hypothetical protein [Algoriphagus antarcticus]REG81847.1 hypothetical protein C8N25_1243 [Algoriphagus antarcticus]
MERSLPIYSTNKSSVAVANEVVNALYPKYRKDPKKFLESLISKLAEANILVF